MVLEHWDIVFVKWTMYFKIKLKQLKVYVLHYCLLIVLQQKFLVII